MTEKHGLNVIGHKHDMLAVLSVRIEVGVSLLLEPTGADKRQGPFSSNGKCRNTAGDSQESTRRSWVLLKALAW